LGLVIATPMAERIAHGFAKCIGESAACIFHQVPTIGDLHSFRPGASSCSAISAAAIPGIVPHEVA
jgi:hypothetical protein